MTRNWNDIQWIFEPDGSLRDIYVQDISQQEWEKLIDYLNVSFNLTYSDTDKIDKEYVLNYLRDTKGEMEGKTLTVHLGQIKANCFFFVPEQIEFDIDPKEVNSINDFEQIEKFMTSISKILQEQVTLTAENTPEFPLFKVDTEKGINKILTEKEARELSGINSIIISQLTILKKKLELKFFPKPFGKRLLKSTNKTYQPTKKGKNA